VAVLSQAFAHQAAFLAAFSSTFLYPFPPLLWAEAKPIKKIEKVNYMICFS
jgi:hypothetical protein